MSTTHRHEETVPYSADDMLALVADVQSYPEFLPWCSGARIRERKETETGEVLVADLIMAYKVLKERFTSRVTIDRQAKTISVEYLKGPFKRLTNEWRFEPLPDGGCRIHFFIEFEFRNRLFQSMIGGLFGLAQERAIHAFVARADDLHGGNAAAQLFRQPS